MVESLNLSSPAVGVIIGVSYLAALLIFLYVARRFVGLKTDESLYKPLLILGPTIILVSPHTLYYDLGIPMVSCAACFSASLSGSNDRAINGLFVLNLLVFAFTVAKNSLPVQPLFFIAAGCFAYVWFSNSKVSSTKATGGFNL